MAAIISHTEIALWNLVYFCPMGNVPLKTLIHVMDSDATASWHQVIGPLRQWHRRRLIDSVVQRAEDLAFDKYLIYDALENLQVEGVVGEKVD